MVLKLSYYLCYQREPSYTCPRFQHHLPNQRKCWLTHRQYQYSQSHGEGITGIMLQACKLSNDQTGRKETRRWLQGSDSSTPEYGADIGGKGQCMDFPVTLNYFEWKQYFKSVCLILNLSPIIPLGIVNLEHTTCCNKLFYFFF